MGSKNITEGWNVENGKLILLLLYFLAYFLLSFSFKNYIVPVWGYQGFLWNPNANKIAESIVILVYLVAISPSKPTKPSDLLVHLFLLMPVLPMLVIYGLENLDRNYMYLVVLGVTTMQLVRAIPFRGSTWRATLSEKELMIFCLFITAMVIIGIIGISGFRYFNLNMLKVYDFRRDAAADLPAIFAYLSPIVSSVILPFALLLAVNNKQYAFAFLAAMGSFAMFGFTSHKGPLFYPFLNIALYYIYKKQKVIRVLLISFLLFTVFAISSYYYFKVPDEEISSIFIRRTLFIPASAGFGYYQFFSTHPHVYLSDSKLVFGLIEYPYKIAPQLMLGELSGHRDVSANTGWLGTAYMHFGAFGMFFFGAVVGYLLRLLDSIVYSKDKSLAASIFTVPFSTVFTSSDIPTAFLTHGMLFAFFLLWIYKPNKQNITH